MDVQCDMLGCAVRYVWVCSVMCVGVPCKCSVMLFLIHATIPWKIYKHTYMCVCSVQCFCAERVHVVRHCIGPLNH